jgi:ATP-dependent RNA helicase RhlE
LTFSDFNLDERLLMGLDAIGFSQPTPIQEAAIPLILQERDLIACAQTGTGKTAAFVLPVIHRILNHKNEHKIKALVLVPTRELAMQIDQNIQGLAYFAPVSSIAVFGGGDGQVFEVQKKALLQGCEVVIATPGRLISLLASFKLDFSQLDTLILDEADRMLDMGFNEDIMKISSYLPKQRQNLMFSATMPPKIRKLANQLLSNPAEINLAVSKPAEGVTQLFFPIEEMDKLKLLDHLLKSNHYPSMIIFASTKDKVKVLDRTIQRIGLKAKAFHSDLSQEERDSAMLAFRNKQLPALIGTDIISRGIDVEGISLVVNFDVPPDPEDYIHRIGRTARAETTGTAITFVNPADVLKFIRIEKMLDQRMEMQEIPAEVGVTPDLKLDEIRLSGKRTFRHQPNGQGQHSSGNKRRPFRKGNAQKNK